MTIIVPAKTMSNDKTRSSTESRHDGESSVCTYLLPCPKFCFCPKSYDENQILLKKCSLKRNKKNIPAPIIKISYLGHSAHI